jgi:hypothetical protein
VRTHAPSFTFAHPRAHTRKSRKIPPFPSFVVLAELASVPLMSRGDAVGENCHLGVRASSRLGSRARLRTPLVCRFTGRGHPPAAPPSLPMFPAHQAMLRRRRRAEVPGQGSPFSSPNEAFGEPTTRRGTCRPAVDPSRHRRGLVASPSLLGLASSTWCAAPKTQGGFAAHARPHAAEAAVDPPDLVRPTYPVFATRPTTPNRAALDQR